MKLAITYLRNRYEDRAMEVFDFVKTLAPKSKLIDLSRRRVKEKFDLAISIGGDGTFFSTISFVNAKYYMGVYPGKSVGSRCSIKYSEYPKIKRFFEKKFKIDKQAIIKVKLNGKDLPVAVNDVVVGASKLGRFFVYELEYRNKKELGAGTGLIAYTKEGRSGFAKSINAKPFNKEHFGLIPLAPSTLGAYKFNKNIPLLEAKIKILGKGELTNKISVGYLSIDGIKYERELFKNNLLELKHGGFVNVVKV